MGNYSYMSVPLSAINRRFAVGEKMTGGQYQTMINACSILSAMRWSCSVQVGAGWTFSSSATDIFLPCAGTGRQCFQPFFAAASATTMPASVYWYTMTRGTTLGYTTTVAGANMTMDYGLAANYANKRIFGPIYASSNNAAAYRTPASYGCSCLRFGSFTGSSPMVFGVWPYSQAYTYGTGFERYVSSAGALGYNMQGNPSSNPGLSAGVLRVCEEMLDTAETMPVPIGFWPYFTGQTAGWTMTGGDLYYCRQSQFRRWIPLVDLGRQRAVWVAFYKTSTANVSFTVTVNGNSIYFTTQNTNYRVYASGTSYYLYAVPIPPEVWAASPRAVAGLPVHLVQVTLPTVNQISVWVGDAP